MIKAVIFDIDGVLIDSFEANLKYYQILMAKAGYRIPTREEYAPLFHMSSFDLIKRHTKLTSDEEINKIWQLGKEIVNKGEFPYELIKKVEGAEEIIESLSELYLLGIVTNRIREGINKIPIISKTNECFKTIISYQDTEKHKPDPEPLLLACQKLKVDPSEAVYVGDQEIDLTAGKEARMKTILFSKEKFGNPDLHTDSLKDLPELVSML